MRAVFHHLGLACQSIATETTTMDALGLAPEGPPVDDPIQKVRVQFFAGVGPRVELIEPLAPDSPVSGLLKRGTRFYHLAYVADDFDGCVQDLLERGFRLISLPAPAAAFGMKRIAFLLSATLTMIELIEGHDVASATG